MLLSQPFFIEHPIQREILLVNALEIRTALVLASIYMFRMLGLFMVLPVLAISAQNFEDYSPTLVGIAIGGYGLMQALLQIPMGALSDKFGRKPVITIGLLVFALGSVIAAYADSLTTLVVGRFIQGGGAIAAAIMALATDVAREKARPVVMAVIGIAIGFSFYIAVLVGPVITARFGISGIFWLTAIGAIASIPMLLLLVPNAVKSAASADLVPNKKGLVQLAIKSQLWRLNASVFLLHLAITLLFVPFPKLLSSVGFELGAQWKVYLPVLVVSIVGLGFIMGIARANKQKKALFLAGACMISALLSLALNDGTNLSVIVIAGALFFTGFNYLEATFPSLVSKFAPAGEKGSAMGIYSSCQFLGAFAGGTLAGVLTERLSVSWVFGLGTLSAALILLVCSRIQNVSKIQRLVLEPQNVHLDKQKALRNVLALEGVVDARWSKTDPVLYVNAAHSVEPNSVQRILNESV